MNYLLTNKKSFIVILIVFFIGMLIGIFVINHTNENEIIEINAYIGSICENLQHSENINLLDCLWKSLKQNIRICTFNVAFGVYDNWKYICIFCNFV